MPVYKDKKRNTWYIKININSRQFVKRGYKTKRDALNDELVFRNECSSVSKKKKEIVITFDYLKRKYYAFRKNNLKPTSYYSLVLKIEKHICPFFDSNINVKELTQYDFNKFRNALSKNNLQTKNRIIKILQDMFDYLDVYYDIRINYAKRLQLFKDYTPKAIDKEPVNKPVEVELFKKYYFASNDYYKFYLLTTYIFGLRISEVRGLLVNAFDLKNNILTISQVTTSKAGINKSLDLIPKTNSSLRKFYLCYSYSVILQSHILHNNLKDTNRLFFSGSKKNLAISENSIRRYLKSIEQDNNLPHITPHGLRHGIASYLFSKGIPFEDVGKYLGHKFNSVTMDVYIDLTKERQFNIIEIINKLIQELENKKFVSQSYHSI